MDIRCMCLKRIGDEVGETFLWNRGRGVETNEVLG
jgi:hypothetical protein